LKLTLEYNRGILFVRIDGNLTRKTSHKINKFLIPAIIKHKIKYLVYNLYGLTALDTSGMNALENGKCAVSVNGGETYACEAPDTFKEILHDLKIKETINELEAIELLHI